jgi:hypothetical protein
MDIRFSSPSLEVPQHHAEITATGRNYDSYHFNQSSFDNHIRELEALTKLTLRPGQVQALQSLAEGKDVPSVGGQNWLWEDVDFHRLQLPAKDFQGLIIFNIC